MRTTHSTRTSERSPLAGRSLADPMVLTYGLLVCGATGQSGLIWLRNAAFRYVPIPLLNRQVERQFGVDF